MGWCSAGRKGIPFPVSPAPLCFLTGQARSGGGRPSAVPEPRDGKGSSLLPEEGLHGVSAVSAVGPLKALVLMVLALILTQYLF